MHTLNQPRVTIIILNWNNWKDTLECLNSLSNIEYSNYNIILVDNGSTDSSLERIRDYFLNWNSKISNNNNGFFFYFFEIATDQIQTTESNKLLKDYYSKNKSALLLMNNENFGFAEGNNNAIKLILESNSSDYILLLNNDVIVDKGFLKHLIQFSEKSDNFGAVGPKMYYYNYQGRNDVINYAGGKIYWFLGETEYFGFRKVDHGQYNVIKEVDTISGACLLSKTSVFRDVGLLNSDYFAYWEETDWCVRASRKGYKLYYFPHAKIWHKVTGSTKHISEFVSYQETRNNFWFMKQHATKFQYIVFFLYFWAFTFWKKLFLSLFYHKNIKIFNSIITGTLDGLKKNPEFL